VIPILALLYAMQFGTLHTLNYVHIMTGAFWTSIDPFMELVVGPVPGSLSIKGRANGFR
jgi:hypothetical protein